MSKMLSSWKEIAQFFGKGVRTVQRWEKTLALPIHRPPGAPSNVVLARTSDLEAWMHHGPAERAAMNAAPDKLDDGELQESLGVLLDEVKGLRSLFSLNTKDGGDAVEQTLPERVKTAISDLRAFRGESASISPEMFVQRIPWPAVLLTSRQQILQANALLGEILQADRNSSSPDLSGILDEDISRAIATALRKHAPATIWEKQVVVDGRRSSFDFHLMPLVLDGGETGLLVLLAPRDGRTQASLAA